MAAPPNHIDVTTEHGVVRGHLSGGSYEFRAIPFAGPFDRAGRFRPPSKPSGWTGVLECNEWPCIAPQIPDTGADKHADLWGRYYPRPHSDQGLALNLWTKSTDAGAKRPVMVWLHGGGFATGAPTRARENGASFATNEDVVVVSPTHRLGVSGYLFLNDLAPREDYSANVGLLDIVASLEWVRTNIENFGGDPGNVTIFGESGGAAKAHSLMAMPKASGLFHKAILQAGALSNFSPITVASRAEATETSLRYLHHLGVSTSRLHRLRTTPIDDLVRADANMSPNLLAWKPVVDGTSIQHEPWQPPPGGATTAIPLLVGSCRHEMDVLYDGDANNEFIGGTRLTEEQKWKITDSYKANRPGAAGREVELAFLTDATFRIPGIQLAETHSQTGPGNVYMYLFDFGYAPNGATVSRATHGSEGVFVFNNTAATGLTATDPSAHALAAKIHGAWAAFARTGAPEHPDLPSWEAFTPQHPATMILKAESAVSLVDQAQDTSVWREVGVLNASTTTVS
ncbi:carboxylesterase family protein [Pseudarthrobacter sp. CC12]|uniref:carboxylesterase/lipase family protein n=1 Tax=Pseudarthrobacter sp. CC12 TaxID=3029193 RepID=UPI003265D6C3